MPLFRSVPILLLLLIVVPILTLAQEDDSLSVDRIASIKKLAQEVQNDTWDFIAKMNSEATRRLQAIQQQEAKLEKHLPKDEIAKALQLKDELNKKLDALAGITNAPDSLLKTMFKGQYFARFDSLEALFKFALPKTGNLAILKDAEIALINLI